MYYIFGFFINSGIKALVDDTYIKRTHYYNTIKLKNYRKYINTEYSQIFDLCLQTTLKYKDVYSLLFLNYGETFTKNYTTYYSLLIQEEATTMIDNSDWIITYTFKGFNFDSALSNIFEIYK